MVDALLLTTLSPHAGKIALNAELGDSAQIERRVCDCQLGRLGLTTHLSGMRSYEKLSSQGASFARSSLITILEEVLPARFGGTPLEYQLVEEEEAGGSTLMVLRVHPGIGDLDEAAVRQTVIQELGRGDLVDAYQARLVERAQSLVVRRLVPVATQAGKVLPFHLQRPGGRAGRVSP